MIKQNVMKAIADDNRLKIIEMLLRQKLCVRALSKRLGISEPATSQHIKVLKEADLLIGKKIKHHIHYEVNRELLHELAQFIENLALTDRTINTENSDSTCQNKGSCKCGCQSTNETEVE
ncbi:metalloregulator ArsR/SmtB family transcription factor [Lacrimispora sp.]|jgi:ArsR family transcriptional regulator|uniref:ArsR/SmtB family transcription factor n=1 Tax=Lacrimispora sp. TaxID=2719234 RepID=UPI0029E5B0C3|nr:ArsR family transcriptional regulator, arsenate/arsenite/antimonite-responsive transcriptional [Lacrimispora sp.]